jgi:Ca2+-binding EF-hand superfamily protein
MITPIDFKFAVRNLGIEIGEDEMAQIMKYFDTTGCGKLSLNDLIHAIREGSLNDRRQRMVEEVYHRLD